MADGNIHIAITLHHCRECTEQPCAECPAVRMPSALEMDAEDLAGAALPHRNLEWHARATVLLRAMAAEINVLRHQLAQAAAKQARLR